MSYQLDTQLKDMLDERLASLQIELRKLEKQREELIDRIGGLSKEIGHITGLLKIHGEDDDTLTSPTPTVQPLPPANLVDAVVDLLRETGGPLHYRRIAEILEKRGLYEPRGKDPADTLLARYYKDPRLYRPQRGHYAIKAEPE